MIDVDGQSPTNVRIYTDGLSKDHKQSWGSWLVAVTTLLVYCGWLHILLGLLVGSFYSRTCLYIFLALLATLALPAKPVLWTAFCKSYVFKTWREYFNYSYLNEALLDPEKNYIFVEFPHGVFPLSELIAGTLCQFVWPNFKIYSLAATTVFNIPFWRHFVAWIGSVPATRANFKRLLSKGSVAVIVGGIAEMYMQSKKCERIKLRNRKGFVKVAIEEGITGGIMPVYHLGNTQLMDFAPQWLAGISRKWRVSLGFLIGRWGFLPLPNQRPLYMVCGKPIPVPKLAKDHPDFEATVDKIHAQVVEQLQELYDRHKASVGWADRPLVIE